MYNNAFVDVVMEGGLVSIALITAVSTTSVNGWVVFLAQLFIAKTQCTTEAHSDMGKVSFG